MAYMHEKIRNVIFGKAFLAIKENYSSECTFRFEDFEDVDFQKPAFH
jgi:hypothetical protein